MSHICNTVRIADRVEADCIASEMMSACATSHLVIILAECTTGATFYIYHTPTP